MARFEFFGFGLRLSVTLEDMDKEAEALVDELLVLRPHCPREWAEVVVREALALGIAGEFVLHQEKGGDSFRASFRPMGGNVPFRGTGETPTAALQNIAEDQAILKGVA